MKKPPIVILHGWGLSGSKFQPLVSLLVKKGYTVFAPDFPGFGSEAPPASAYHLSDYASFVATYLKKHHIVDPIFIGHSFGGRVSLKFSAMFPGLVRAYILTGTPGFTPVPRKKLMVFIAVAKIGNWIFQLPGFRLVQDSVRKWYYYVVGAREFYRANGVMRQVFKNIVEERLDALMVAIHVPCLLVWGQEDQITPTWIAKRMHETIEKSQLIILPDADHGVSFREPERFVDAIVPFLKTI
jgi:pimeloyl-ACP methyl ester carboxylesterase